MKTTKKDFEYFKERCAFWADVLGLHSWRIDYENGPLNNAYGRCSFNVDNHVVRIMLSNDWGEERVSESQLDATAQHEVLHVLIEPLLDRFTSVSENCVRSEGVIRTIAKALRESAK